MNLNLWMNLTPEQRQAWVDEQYDVIFLKSMLAAIDDSILPTIDMLEQVSTSMVEIEQYRTQREAIEDTAHRVMARLTELSPLWLQQLQ